MQIVHRLPSGGPLGRWCWAAASAPVGAHSWSPAGVGGSLDTPLRPAGCSEGLGVSKRGPAGGGSGCGQGEVQVGAAALGPGAVLGSGLATEKLMCHRVRTLIAAVVSG